MWKFLVSTTKFGCAGQKFGSSNQKFRNAGQNFGCLNPHYFLIGLTKNEGQPDQNFGQPNQIAIWLSQPLKKVKGAYKISMNVC